MKLTKTFEVGDKVFLLGRKTKDCVITKKNKLFMFTVKGKEYKDGEWQDFEVDKVQLYELCKTDEEANAETSDIIRTKKDEWEKIIDRRTHDFRVSDLYKKMYEKQLDLSPFYQRDFVWTLEQKQAYIENLFKGKAVITPTFIQCSKPVEDRIDSFDFDVLEVVDGKQRLSTIFEFLENQFCLEDGVYFKNLNAKDKIELLFMNVKATEITPRKWNNDLTDEQKIELFLEINELGTKMSEEHLKNIKEKYLKK